MKNHLFRIGVCIAAAGLALSLASLLWVQPGQAAPTTASTSSLTVCPAGPPSCDYTDIQAAVDAAAPGDVIKVAAGLYTGVQQRPAPSGYYGPSFITQLVYISKTLTLSGGYTPAFTEPPDPLANPTTLDAQGQGRVLFVTGDSEVVVTGLHLTGGDATGLGGERHIYDVGGGVCIIAATTTLSNNWVLTNTAYQGSGVYSYVSTVAFSHNVIRGNANDGVYVNNNGYAMVTPHTMIDHNTISHNTDFGLRLANGYDALIYDNTISYNTYIGLIVYSSEGALIRGNTLSYNAGGAALNSDAVEFIENSVISNTSPYCGGVCLSQSPSTIARNVISGNVANSGEGGGLRLTESDARLDSNIITANTAHQGGGIYLQESDATLLNNIISDNRAVQSGSGIFIWESAANLLHTTIARNTGGDGSGVYIIEGYYDYPTLTNTILVSQTVGIYLDGDNAVRLAATMWGAGAWANGSDWAGNSSLITGTLNVWADPLFVNPDAGDYHIQGISPARDAGLETSVRQDIDGQSRPMDWGPDIGADEYPGAGLAVAAQPDAALANVGQALTYTLRVTNAGLSPANGLVLTGTLDQWQQPVAVTASVGGCSIVHSGPTGSVVCTADALPVGQADLITITSLVSASTPMAKVITHAFTLRANETRNAIQVSNMAQDCHARINTDSTEYLTVQAAVDTAAPGDLVKVAGYCLGVNHYVRDYQHLYLGKSLTVRGGYTTTNWSQTDPQANPTTLDAREQGRVIRIGRYTSATVEALHITGGTAYGGGGVLVERIAAATLRDNTIFKNRATGGNGGGGIYLWECNAILTGNIITDNYAYLGGGLDTVLSNALISANTIASNTSRSGAGVWLDRGNITFTHNLVRDNSCWDYGGGIAVRVTSAVLDDNLILSNHCGEGGGVWLDTDVKLNNNIIRHNTASRGGGIYIDQGSPVLTNTVIADNQASYHGSGVYISGQYPQFMHTTLARNTGGDGSGIYVDEQYCALRMTNTIFVSHTTGISVTPGGHAALIATLWGEGEWANTTAWRGNVYVGDINRWGYPDFVNPDAGDYHIGPNSAAIDAGLDSGVSTDLDGDPRPQGSGYDLGADELLSPIFILSKTITAPGQGVTNGDRFTVALTVSPTWRLTETMLFTVTDPNLYPGLLDFVEISQTAPAVYNPALVAIEWVDTLSPTAGAKTVQFQVRVKDFASIPGQQVLTNTAYVRVHDPAGLLLPGDLPGSLLPPSPYGERGTWATFGLVPYAQTSWIGGSQVVTFSNADGSPAVVISPTLAMGYVTLTQRYNQVCTTLHPTLPDDEVLHCYNIEADIPACAEVTFYYAASEAGNNLAPNVWHWDGLNWVQQPFIAGDPGGDPAWVRASLCQFSPFVLADSTPTSVALWTWATRAGRSPWLVIGLLSSLLVGGLSLCRRRKSRPA